MQEMSDLAKAAENRKRQRDRLNAASSDRWTEGLENHEKLKKILPFLNEEEGYL